MIAWTVAFAPDFTYTASCGIALTPPSQRRRPTGAEARAQNHHIDCGQRWRYVHGKAIPSTGEFLMRVSPRDDGVVERDGMLVLELAAVHRGHEPPLIGPFDPAVQSPGKRNLILLVSRFPGIYHMTDLLFEEGTARWLASGHGSGPDREEWDPNAPQPGTEAVVRELMAALDEPGGDDEDHEWHPIKDLLLVQPDAPISFGIQLEPTLPRRSFTLKWDGESLTIDDAEE